MRQTQEQIPRPRRRIEVESDLVELRHRRGNANPVGVAYEVMTEQIDDLLGELWAMRDDG